MLTFRLLSDDGETVRYAYTPEGRGERGEIMVDKVTGRLTSRSLAPGDEFGIYAVHMVARAREFSLSGAWPESGIVAWG